MDRAYEGNETRQLALALGFTPVVPPLATRVEPWQYDRHMYKRRNEIERLFRRLKGFRRVFSRFEKLDVIFLGFILFSLIIEGLTLVLTGPSPSSVAEGGQGSSERSGQHHRLRRRGRDYPSNGRAGGFESPAILGDDCRGARHMDVRRLWSLLGRASQSPGSGDIGQGCTCRVRSWTQSAYYMIMDRG